MKRPSVKLPFSKSKRRPPEPPTVEIRTFEDLFTAISELKRNVKKARKDGVKVEFDVDPDVDAPSEADADQGQGGGRGSGGDGGDPEKEDSDVHSVSSYSSMATMDDNPGTGRIMDKYIYQPVGRFVEKCFMFVAFQFHVNRGGRVRWPHIVPVPDGDGVSLQTWSTTSTATDLPGTGRIIDKYVYQVVGGMIERCAGRFVMSHFLSAITIYERVEELWHNVEVKEPCFVCRHPGVDSMTTAEKIKMAVEHIEGAPSGKFILSGMKELTKRMRSKILFRRVEAKLICDNLFELDALHVVKDAEEVSSALSRENTLEDEKELNHRLSKRAEKLQEKGKQLPRNQKIILDAIGAQFDDRLFISGKPRTGYDVLPLLQELISKSHDTLVSEGALILSLLQEMILRSLPRVLHCVSHDVPCQELTEELEALYLTLAFYSKFPPSTMRHKCTQKRQALYAAFWLVIERIVKFVMRSYAVPGCQKCGPSSPLKPCLCLDKIIVLYRSVSLFVADDNCVYENVLRDAVILLDHLFTTFYSILLTTFNSSETRESIHNGVAVMFLYASGLHDTLSTRYWGSLEYEITAVLENQKREHGTRYQKVLAECTSTDFWDEKRLRILRDSTREQRHSHADASVLDLFWEEFQLIALETMRKLMEKKRRNAQRNSEPSA